MIGVYDDFVDAFKAIVETHGGELYRMELIMSMKEDEAGAVKDLLTAEIEPVEAPVGRVEPQKRVVVFDPETDPREFVNTIYSFEDVEFYINSKHIDEDLIDRINVRIYDTVSEEDFIKFLKTLSSRSNIILVTSDKRIYVKSLSVKGVKPIYRLPEENVEEILEEAIEAE